MNTSHGPTTTHRLTATITLIAALATGTGTATSIATAQAPTVTIVGATAAETELVAWALDLYTEAGLELPAVTIQFHEDFNGCRGYNGYYTRIGHTVDICNRGDLKVEARHTLVHELAHAWKFETLTAADTAAFTARRGLEAWDEGEAWWQMGQEQAAEVISWALIDGLDNHWVHLEGCEDLAAEYTALTGLTPLNTASNSCK